MEITTELASRKFLEHQALSLSSAGDSPVGGDGLEVAGDDVALVQAFPGQLGDGEEAGMANFYALAEEVLTGFEFTGG